MIRETNVPVAVDVIVRRPGTNEFLLVRRRNPPEGWALPGGFLEAGESLAEAAVRETKEETGLDVELTQQFFAYSRPGRDPRGPVVSVVFVAAAIEDEEPKGADDAAEARFFRLSEFEGASGPRLAFDHRQILEDFFNWTFYGQRPAAGR